MAEEKLTSDPILPRNIADADQEVARGISVSESSAVKTAKDVAPQSQSPTGESPLNSATTSISNKATKKRKKVNHACLYCRRSHMTCDNERPCTRCVKRDIGHLCHDEPREHKRLKAGPIEQLHGETSPGTEKALPSAVVHGMNTNSEDSPPVKSGTVKGKKPSSTLPGSAPTSSVISQGSGSNPALLTDWSTTQQTWNPYHHQWMFSNPEVSTEYNLMNEFLLNSIYDEAVFPGDNTFPDVDFNINPRSSSSQGNSSSSMSNNINQGNSMPIGRSVPTKTSVEKAKELYYLTAADPPEDGVPEERMKQVLKAKHDAGLLKPFNYINGYKRLQNYMDKNMSAASKQRVLRSLQGFRPKFRERTQKLTDIDLVFVEELFERSLMEYDRVFASMAVPACLWRRTGEIFRGNKEFAELIQVPVEMMRDGKLAIYELIAEESAVSYWEKFGTIAFDPGQKAMLTSCFLHNPDQNSPEALIHCCFSFTIVRDKYDIPLMIVGNFLPIPP